MMKKITFSFRRILPAPPGEAIAANLGLLLAAARTGPHAFRRTQRLDTSATSTSVPVYVTVLFVACLAILTGTAISNYRNLQKLRQNNYQMEQSWYVQDHLKNINLLIVDAEDSLLGYDISGDQAFLTPLQTAREGLAAEFQSLEKLTNNNQIQRQHLAQLRALFDRRMEQFEEHAAHFKHGGLKEVVDIVKRRESMEIMDEVRLLEVTMERDEASLLTARRNRFYEEFDRTLMVTYLVSGVAVLILIVFYRLIHQHFSKQRTIEEALKRTNETLETTVLARTAKLSVLSRHLLKISEVEKAKLARELHDEMGSNLTVIGMDIMIVAEKLKKIQPDLANQLLKTKQTLHETVELKRRIVEDLRPSMLDTLGLVACIRNHCEKVIRIPGLHYEEDFPEEFDGINPEWAIALFRIVQESLNNVIKYAEATRVKISLKRKESGLWLQIIDNGIGMPQDALDKPKSHGLLGMRERVLLLGGDFSIKRGMENAGTAIEVFLPFIE